MKKYFSLVLAVVMMLALAVTAFAIDIDAPGENSQDVTASYQKPNLVDGGTVYSVTIEWETAQDSTLKYEGKNATYNWSAASLKYEETVNNTDGTYGWSGSAKVTVTVTNKSNASVTATTSATAEYELTLNKPADETKVIGSAAVKDDKAIEYTDTESVGAAQNATFEYTYEANDDAADPTVSDATSVKIGSITVTIAA